MKRFLFSFFAFIVIGSSIQAQTNMVEDVIQVDDVEILPGGTATITVRFNATNAPTTGIKGVQFDLYLPEGFSLEKTNPSKRNCKVFDIQDPGYTVGATTVLVNGTELLNQIRFTMASYTDNTLTFEDGDLFSVTLVANEGIDIQPYQGVLAGKTGMATNITLTGDVGNETFRYPQEAITFNIKMPIELSEEISYAQGFGNYTDAMVRMNKRVLKAETWNTICLPFDMDADAIKAAFGEDNIVTIARLEGSETIERNGKIKAINIKFNTTQSTITANTPYLIKLSEGVETFDVEGVSLSDNIVASSVDVGDCIFHGNYDVIDNLGADGPKLFISGNQFYYVSPGKTTKMKSFRGYFTHTDLERYINEQSQGANITIFVDDEPTGIRNIITTPSNNDVYDLSGRKLNTDNTNRQKGVYIINGKKEAIR